MTKDLDRHKEFLKDKRVLVADDQHAGRVALVRTLEVMGFKSVTAVDGGGLAWKHIRTGLATSDPFHLIVSDCHMDQIGGLSLLKKVRSHEETSDLPLILLTELRDDAEKAKALSAGASCYIVKPLDLADFCYQVVETLQEALRRSRRGSAKR